MEFVDLEPKPWLDREGRVQAADLMITTIHFIHRYVASSVDFFAWRLLPLTMRLKDKGVAFSFVLEFWVQMLKERNIPSTWAKGKVVKH